MGQTLDPMTLFPLYNISIQPEPLKLMNLRCITFEFGEVTIGGQSPHSVPIETTIAFLYFHVEID